MDYDYPRTRNYGGSQPEGEVHPPLDAKVELIARSSYRLGVAEAKIRQNEQRLGDTQSELAKAKTELNDSQYYVKRNQQNADYYQADLEKALAKVEKLEKQLKRYLPKKKVIKKKASK